MKRLNHLNSVLTDSLENIQSHPWISLSLQVLRVSNLMSQKDTEIARFKNYSLRLLTPKYRQLIWDLLVQEYVDQQPLSIGYCRKYPEKLKELKQNWHDFYGAFIDYSIASGCGIVAVDLCNNDELVGVTVTRDFTYFADDFKKKILNGDGFGKPMMYMQQLMVQKAKPEYQQLLRKKGVVLNIWGAAIKKNHMGKQLFHQMILANERLGKQKGYQYGYVYACNAKSGVAAQKAGYQKIGEYHNHELEMDGQKPFALVDQGHKVSTIWLKKL